MKYKRGDRMKIISCSASSSICDCVGKVGKIIDIQQGRTHEYILDVEHRNENVDNAWADDELEPVNEFQPFYVDCPTQEIWDKVEKKMFEMGYKWNFGKEHLDYCNNNLSVGVLGVNIIGHGSSSPSDKALKSIHIPYRQFLGEEGVMKEREFRVGDKVEITASADNGHFAVGSIGTITEYDKDGTKDYRIKVGVLECWTRNGTYKLITPVEEKEEKHKNLVAEYPLPPMYTLTNDWTNGGGYVSFGVDLGTEQVNPFYKLSKSLMSGFKKATAFIKRLGEPLSTYYSLGWVELENDEFTTTPEGKQALADFTLIGGAKTFEEYAKKELARRKKASKDEDED